MREAMIDGRLVVAGPNSPEEAIGPVGGCRETQARDSLDRRPASIGIGKG